MQPRAVHVAVPADLTPDAAQRYCRQLAESHYENFTVASRLLPLRLYQHFCNVYAYCRWADDLADEQSSPHEALALLDWWQQELNATYAGQPQHPVFVALSQTIREVDLPQQPFDDLLIAFRRDQTQTRYETLDDLLTYCDKSANPVGRIVLQLGRCASDENMQLSDSICTGLQLANFWQDAHRDYERGRIYIPQDLCRRYGWDEAHFAAKASDSAFRDLLQPLVEQADAMLVAGQPLIRKVCRELQVPVQLFVGGGRAILAAIR